MTRLAKAVGLTQETDTSQSPARRGEHFLRAIKADYEEAHRHAIKPTTWD
jgi:hypothetical protein